MSAPRSQPEHGGEAPIDSSLSRCPRCDCPDNAPQCDHCKVCPHASGPATAPESEFVIALYEDGGTLTLGIRPDGQIETGPSYEPEPAAREFWDAVTRAAQSASPWGDQSAFAVTSAMVRAAAEAMEDACLTHLGRDLGTIHRDDIARQGLEAAARIAQFASPWPDQPNSEEQS